MKTTACISSIKLVLSGYNDEHWVYILYNTVTKHSIKSIACTVWMLKWQLVQENYQSLLDIFLWLIRSDLDNELFINTLADNSDMTAEIETANDTVIKL